jgi:chromate transport protein ChrA
MDISTLQMLALMACGVAIIVGFTLATTSNSRLVKAGGYALTATLIAVIAAAVFHASAKDLEALHARNIAGLWLVAAAGWAGVNAIRAYR